MALSIKRSSRGGWAAALVLAVACNNDPASIDSPTEAQAGSAAAPASGTSAAGSSGGSGGRAANGGGVAGRNSVEQGGAARAGTSGAAGMDGEDDAGAGEPDGESSAGASGEQAGSGGVPGGAAGAGGEGAPVSGEAAHRPKCKTSPEQVIVIGDSYINWITHTFPDDLAREAGETWRMYAVGGCSLGSGGLCLIPDQLDQAIAEDPNIIASVMTGGGNDILIADEAMYPGGGACKDQADSPTMQVCRDIVATSIAAGETLMQTAADAGIRDVIYMFYPHIPGGGFGGMNPTPLLDYALPMARDLCERAEQRTEGKLRCHFIDLVPVFEGHPDWFADDGIHENSLGSAAMAKEVVRVAREACIAQPASSGCCEP